MAEEGTAGPVQDNTDGAASESESTGSTLLTGGEGANPEGAAAGAEGEGSGEGSDEGEPEGGTADVPEEYADFAVPEGATLDEDVLGKFKSLAKDAGLSQDKAQSFVDLVAPVLGSVAAQQEAQQAEWQSTRESWVSDLKADPEFGGDNFPATVERASRALREYGSKDLVEYLEATGLGDNTELVKAFARADKATGEKPSVGGDGAPAPKEPGEAMYPSMAKA